MRKALITLNALALAISAVAFFSVQGWLSLLLVATYSMSIGALVGHQKKAFCLTTYVLVGLLMLWGAVISVIVLVLPSELQLSHAILFSVGVGGMTVALPLLSALEIRRKYAKDT